MEPHHEQMEEGMVGKSLPLFLNVSHGVAKRDHGDATREEDHSAAQEIRHQDDAEGGDPAPHNMNHGSLGPDRPQQEEGAREGPPAPHKAHQDLSAKRPSEKDGDNGRRQGDQNGKDHQRLHPRSLRI